MPVHEKQPDEVLRHFHIKSNQNVFLKRKCVEFQAMAGTSVVITEDMLVQGALEEWMKNEQYAAGTSGKPEPS